MYTEIRNRETRIGHSRHNLAVPKKRKIAKVYEPDKVHLEQQGPPYKQFEASTTIFGTFGEAK